MDTALKYYTTSHQNLTKLWEAVGGMSTDKTRMFLFYFVGALSPYMDGADWESLLADCIEGFNRYENERAKSLQSIQPKGETDDKSQ